MRSFPTWMEVIKCFERYEKLNPEDKLTYDLLGKFPDLVATSTGQTVTVERVERDRLLALACVEELINQSDDPQDSYGEGVIDGCHFKDNKKLSFRISKRPQVKKLVPNSGLTKCFKRWSLIYPELKLFKVEDVAQEITDAGFKVSNGASKIIKLESRLADVEVARELIDKYMCLPSEIELRKDTSSCANFYPSSVTSHKHWRKGDEIFKYDVALVTPLTEVQLRVEVQGYLAGLLIKPDKAARSFELAKLLTDAIVEKYNGDLKINLTG